MGQIGHPDRTNRILFSIEVMGRVRIEQPLRDGARLNHKPSLRPSTYAAMSPPCPFRYVDGARKDLGVKEGEGGGKDCRTAVIADGEKRKPDLSKARVLTRHSSPND